MKPLDLYLFLTSYTLTVAAAAVAELLTGRRARYLIPAVVGIGALVANTVVGVYLNPDQDYLAIVQYLVAERDLSSLAALLMGAAAAFVWWTRRWGRSEADAETAWSWFEPTLLATSVGCVVLCGQAFVWKEILGFTRHAVSVSDPRFLIAKIADLDDEPTRLTSSSDGDVFICYDYFKKHGALGGVVIRLRQDPVSGEFHKKTVVESPLLARCYGIAIKDGDLYVSRSGFFPKSRLGNVSYESTGAVTQLRDLDGDGYFEYAHDIVSGLPGVRAPDTMQQNNGLVFAADGSLLVTNAGAADRTLDEHPWGGAIVRLSPDFSQTEVYARGFRNPWTIVIGPDDQLFVTDSDVDRNPGDEINHVVRGGHYGHPFVIPNEAGVDPVGFREPMVVAERETVFLGMAYATAPSLPADFRDCLYVTDFRRNRILRMRLVRSGDTYRVAETVPFASIPSPVDLTVTPSGDFYVISRRAMQVYRISLKKAVAE
jgi:glucose/arabinose dehydrogenase